MKKLTIFTPTYNRANKLFRLYCSLCAQRDKDFEWLIVDDGSMDNTEDIVREWISENIITIYYYKQQNEGKMRAHNYGVSLTNTSYFVCVDSDDYLIDSAVEIICKSMNDIPSGISIGGIIFLKTLQGQDIQQAKVSKKIITLHDLYDNGFNGETTIVFKTSVIKKFPFPVIEGEKFITESIVYDIIDVSYKYLYIPEEITICEYCEDGYTKNILELYKNNPCGYVNYFYQKWEIYKNRIYREKAYSYTFLIKDLSKKKEYRKKFFTLSDKIFGFLRFIKMKYRYRS